MHFANRLALLFALPVFLSSPTGAIDFVPPAADTWVLRSVALTPSRTRAELVSKFHPKRGRVCGGIARGGTGTAYWPDLDLPVGFHNVERGGRRRCRYGTSYTFESFLRFNIGGLPPGRRVYSATLEFTQFDHNSLVHWVPGRGPRESLCSVNASASVHRMTRRFEAGHFEVEEHSAAGPRIATIPETPVHALQSVDLTRQVRGWVDGVVPNHGIVVRGRDYRYRRGNEICATHLRHATLHVVFD